MLVNGLVGRHPAQTGLLFNQYHLSHRHLATRLIGRNLPRSACEITYWPIDSCMKTDSPLTMIGLFRSLMLTRKPLGPGAYNMVFYAEALRAHLGSLATGHCLGTILLSSGIVRFVLGRCRKNLPLYDLIDTKNAHPPTSRL